MNTMSQIRYMRSAHQYVATLPGGQEITAPNRADAETAYLATVAPQLGEKVSRIAQTHPELADRARRAAFLVLAGNVTLTPGKFTIHHSGVQTEYFARVTSQAGEGDYDIAGAGGQVVCNCPDGNPQEVGYDGAPRSKVSEHTCKHILAFLLAAESNSPRPGQGNVASAVDPCIANHRDSTQKKGTSHEPQ